MCVCTYYLNFPSHETSRVARVLLYFFLYRDKKLPVKNNSTNKRKNEKCSPMNSGEFGRKNHRWLSWKRIWSVATTARLIVIAVGTVVVIVIMDYRRLAIDCRPWQPQPLLPKIAKSESIISTNNNNSNNTSKQKKSKSNNEKHQQSSSIHEGGTLFKDKWLQEKKLWLIGSTLPLLPRIRWTIFFNIQNFQTLVLVIKLEIFKGYS